MAVETTLILLVRASCPFSPNPSPVDVLTAEITCLVFRKQWRFRRYRRIRTYLTYPPATRMLVDTDLKSMQRRLETELRELRESRDALPVQAVSIALAMKTASA